MNDTQRLSSVVKELSVLRTFTETTIAEIELRAAQPKREATAWIFQELAHREKVAAQRELDHIERLIFLASIA